MKKEVPAGCPVLAARALLDKVTPLNRDCGALCGAACCQADEDGRGGMLLYPGEENCYADLPAGFSLREVPEGMLLTCKGACERHTRPLACRVFPLVMTVMDNRPGVMLDPRAWPLCPLMPSGIQGLRRDFVEKVHQAAELLSAHPRQRAFLERQQRLISAYTQTPWQEGKKR